MKAIVIGAGIAGLAAACRLAQKGYRVTVFESNEYPGGKLTAISSKGFRFDAGPSLFTLPHLLDDVFHATKENPRDFYDYETLDVACHYFYEDGTTLKSFCDQNKFASEVSEKLNIDGGVVVDFLQRSEVMYNQAGQIFLNNSLHKATTWLKKDVLSALLRIYKYDLFKSMDAANQIHLKHPKLVQLFDRYATYNGSNPYKAPGILNSIAHLEHNLGTYFPKGGMHTITLSLYELAQKKGVEFVFGKKVSRIRSNKNKVTGVDTEDGFTQADLVVSNMDVYPTYKYLLPQIKTPERIEKQERSSSGLVFYWGVKGAFSNLGLHNIFFSENYKEEFHHLFDKQRIYQDPTVYVNITSKLNNSDAPEGHENWFVMVNAPSNTGQDWQTIIAQTREAVIKKLSRLLNKNLSEIIVTEELLNPMKIEERTSSFKGSLYGTSSNSKFAAFLRHANFSSKIKGLYFCGGSVHPGGGIPLCLLSAKIVSELVPEIS
ncbi:phytoene desaturase [Fulvivirga sp. M361]|uniref:1-hydroxycarotenoid 3,4-desaturase CrtD n=1 Tax=Fulvivirga sp. M361 TaxID=2594266 RepID=UPI00117A133A|nr:1-hydroxycarotenoid 3,4-desaturase CrtD [Fulvivirga sp. M361]TRX57557.1 phytoene desaturase [Fulvivirga sp. M361]